MNKFINGFKKYFPESKQKWKMYFSSTVPIIFATMIFALNSFVDNFMSINIEGGNQALSYANTWTEIQIGIISLTAVVGSSLFAQYLGSNDVKKVKEVICFRMLFSLFISLCFALPSFIIPKSMIDLVSGYDDSILSVVYENATSYLRLIAVSWVINSIAFTIAMILREKHHSIVTFITSCISLGLNIILNSIFIYGCHFGIEFLAYSTIISIVVPLFTMILFIVIKDRILLINPLKIFFISKIILMQFIRRSLSFILFAMGSVFVNIRFIFWNIGYPTGSVGNPDYALSAANILGISGMLFNIFWTTFESITSNAAIYVGKELGKNNFDLAIKNANELEGFQTLIALIMGIVLFCLSFAVQATTSLADGYKQGVLNHLINDVGLTKENAEIIANQGVDKFLSELKYTIWPLAMFMPMFVWFVTRSRVISVGGKTNIVALTEAIFGALQIGWLCLISFVFKKQCDLQFGWAYFIFFLADIPKVFVYEFLYHKVNWVNNITIEK